jgi:hypothetical protein
MTAAFTEDSVNFNEDFQWEANRRGALMRMAAEKRRLAALRRDMDRLRLAPLPSMAEWEKLDGFGKFDLAMAILVSPSCITEELLRRESLANTKGQANSWNLDEGKNDCLGTV